MGDEKCSDYLYEQTYKAYQIWIKIFIEDFWRALNISLIPEEDTQEIWKLVVCFPEKLTRF
jgi:hypothetical protein